MIVERFVPGQLYRMFVVGERLVSVVRRETAYVVGDGERTVRQLAERANDDPRRGSSFVSPFAAGREVDGSNSPLAVGGASDDVVPAAGQTVLLRRDLFLRGGGYEVERVADVHPDLARLVVDAVRVVGLDIAGLDVSRLALRTPGGASP